MASKYSSKIQLQVQVSVSQQVQKELRSLIAHAAKKALGPKFQRMMTGSGDADGAPVTPENHYGGAFVDFPGRQRLEAHYQHVWAENYAEYASKITNSPSYASWKDANRGKKPYAGPMTITTSDSAYMTRYLYTSVDQAFGKTKGTAHLSTPDFALIGGFTFNPDTYPARAWPLNQSGAKYDTEPYVDRFAQFLESRDIIGSTDELVHFSNAQWKDVRRLMAEVVKERAMQIFAAEFSHTLGRKP